MTKPRWMLVGVVVTLPFSGPLAAAGNGARATAGAKGLAPGEWATLLGGSDSESGPAIAMAPDGDVVVAGGTSSTDFPVTPDAWQRQLVGAGEAYVAKLSPDGTTLRFATYLGGPGWYESARAVAVAANGEIVVTGTAAEGFPVTPDAFDPTFNGGAGVVLPCGMPCDTFVAKFAPDGTLIFSTYLGGLLNEEPRDLLVGPEGQILVVGETSSADFPVTAGAYDTSWAGGVRGDLFLAELSSDGKRLVWSTFLGGAAMEWNATLAWDAEGDIWVGGQTYSSDFPLTPDAYDRSMGFLSDGFVSRLSGDGSALLYSTFFGGDAQQDLVFGIAPAPDGSLWLQGSTLSEDFPVTPGAFDTTFNGDCPFLPECPVPFVSHLDADKGTLLASTFVGQGSTARRLLGLDFEGNALVALTSTGEVWESQDSGQVEGATEVGSRQGQDDADCFFVLFDAGLSRVRKVRRVGGTESESCGGLAVDGAGRWTYAVGASSSADFPATPGVVDTTNEGAPLFNDAFVASFRIDLLLAADFESGDLSEWSSASGG